MADRGQNSIATRDDERQREFQQDAGHMSHGRRMASGVNHNSADEPIQERGDEEQTSPPPKTKKTRGGTRDQHIQAGKKGGSRIRELIELGYKYEEEHGIGPGRSERSKMAARRRNAPRTEDENKEEGEENAANMEETRES